MSDHETKAREIALDVFTKDGAVQLPDGTMQMEFKVSDLESAIASALQEAEQRGAEKEREECAKIVSLACENDAIEGEVYICARIAKLIRAKKETSNE